VARFRQKAIEIAPRERRWRWSSTCVDEILATTQVDDQRVSAFVGPDFNRWLVGRRLTRVW
jgi:hypothetical protein